MAISKWGSGADRPKKKISFTSPPPAPWPTCTRLLLCTLHRIEQSNLWLTFEGGKSNLYGAGTHDWTGWLHLSTIQTLRFLTHFINCTPQRNALCVAASTLYNEHYTADASQYIWSYTMCPLIHYTLYCRRCPLPRRGGPGVPRPHICSTHQEINNAPNQVSFKIAAF